MEDKTRSFLTIPISILISSIILSIAILMHGGVIQVGSGARLGNTPAAPAAPAAPAGQQAAKTVDQMVQGFKDAAKALGLDTNKFNACLDNNDKASAVTADYNDGTTAGVNGTPAFFVNGRLLSGAQPFSEFQTIIEEELSGKAPATTARVTVANGNLPALGNANAPITIVEFSDYQCPFCERFYTQTEGQLKSAYIDTGKVKMYYRDFPLSQIHPGAQKGAEAARCASDQNKYWEFHNYLFENQSSIF